MIVLKIIGWILLGLLALILLALCVRIRMRIEYSAENTSAFMYWLFVKIKLYPKKKKEEKPKEEKPEEEKEEEEKEEEPKKKGGLLKTLYEAEGIDGLVTILRTTLYHTGTFLNSLMRGFVIDELYVDVRCSKQDAAETAVYYGEVCSVLFPLFGALASKCRLKKYDINVYPDYLAKFSDASFVTKLHFTPIYLLGITLAYVFRLLFGVILKVVFKISGANKNKKSSRDKNNKSKEKRDAK